MELINAIKRLILGKRDVREIANNPYDERLTFIMDDDNIPVMRAKEGKVWYGGDGNELLNFYRDQAVFDNMKEPIYNANRRNYFYAISKKECNIKRVHSGVPRAIIDTIDNIVGIPKITIEGKGIETLTSDFYDVLFKQEQPLTLAEGWGALKIIVPSDRKFIHPIVQFYEAENVEIVTQYGQPIAIIFKEFYEYDKKTYVLLETRGFDKEGNAQITYELFRLKGENSVEPCELSEVPSLANLQDVTLTGYHKLLAVPCVFFHDYNNPNCGLPIFNGKIDLFDDLDQCLSQRSQTDRVSTPVEYYPDDLLERSPNGGVIMPSVYNRQFVAKPSIPSGDGTMDGQIQTTQPRLDFAQYSDEAKAILDQILIGILSPASLGFNIAKDSTDMSQREKEKVTIMTRNSIVHTQTEIIRKCVGIMMDFDVYMRTGRMPKDVDYDISVKFNDFANPSFESMSKVLLPLWTNGAISTRMYVDKLYGDSLSDEEKEKEIEELERNRKADSLPSLMEFDHVEKTGQGKTEEDNPFGKE